MHAVKLKKKNSKKINKLNQIKSTFSKLLSVFSDINALPQVKSNCDKDNLKLRKSYTETAGGNFSVEEFKNTGKNHQQIKDGLENCHDGKTVCENNKSKMLKAKIDLPDVNAGIAGGTLSMGECRNMQKRNQTRRYSTAHQFCQNDKITCAYNNNWNMPKVPVVSENNLNSSVAEYKNTHTSQQLITDGCDDYRVHQFGQDDKITCVHSHNHNNNNWNMPKSNIKVSGVIANNVNMENSNADGNLSVAEYKNTQTSHQPITDGCYDYTKSQMTLINYLKYLPGNDAYDMWDYNLDLDVSSVNVIGSDKTTDSTIKQCKMSEDNVTLAIEPTPIEPAPVEPKPVETQLIERQPILGGYTELPQKKWNDTNNLQKTLNNVTWTQDVLNELIWLPEQNDYTILNLSSITSAMDITTVNQVMQQQSPQVSLDDAINMSKTTQTTNDVNASPCTLPENNLEMLQEEINMDFDKNESDDLAAIHAQLAMTEASEGRKESQSQNDLFQEAIHEQPVMTEAPKGGKESESQNDLFQEVRNEKLNIQLNIRPKNKTGCDKSNMIVKASDNTSKKLCCPFCDNLYSKVARHYKSIHTAEPDVQKLLSYEEGSNERRVIQDLLRKIGCFNWNMNAEINNKELITSRRPNQQLNKKATDYKACPYCLGEYANLRHHVAKNCPQKPAVNEQFKGERVITVLSKTVEARYSEKANVGLTKMFNSMQEDDILRLIKFDWLLIEFGNRLCLKYNAQKDKGNKSNQLRTAGRILSTMKSINSEVRDFASIYQLELFDSVIDAIKIMNEFNPSTNEFKTPGPASTCVAIIKRIGVILKSQYIRRRNPVKRMETEEFLTLTDTDMPYVITKAITDTKSRMRRERKVNLPSSEDVQRLAQYICDERNAVFEELKKHFSYKNWVKLSELTLASVLVFNRRRVGETQQIKVSDFTSRESFDEKSTGELFAALSEENKLVVKQYTRMLVRGKKDRTVPVLINRNVEACIEVLLDNRQDAGIESDNKWLFALPSSIKTNSRFINGWTVLSTLRKNCGAVNPSSLTGTNLRKHMATFCVTLELNDGLVSEVADHMGHSGEVHRGWYRNNTVDRQIVTMSKILEAAQGNTADNKTKTDEGSTSPVGVIQNHARNVVQKRKITNQPTSDNESKPVRKRKKQSENEKEVSQPRKGKVVPKRKIKSQPSNECESEPARKRKKQSENEMEASQPKTGKVVPKRDIKSQPTGTDVKKTCSATLPEKSRAKVC